MTVVTRLVSVPFASVRRLLAIHMVDCAGSMVIGSLQRISSPDPLRRTTAPLVAADSDLQLAVGAGAVQADHPLPTRDRRPKRRLGDRQRSGAGAQQHPHQRERLDLRLRRRRVRGTAVTDEPRVALVIDFDDVERAFGHARVVRDRRRARRRQWVERRSPRA